MLLYEIKQLNRTFCLLSFKWDLGILHGAENSVIYYLSI